MIADRFFVFIFFSLFFTQGRRTAQYGVCVHTLVICDEHVDIASLSGLSLECRGAVRKYARTDSPRLREVSSLQHMPSLSCMLSSAIQSSTHAHLHSLTPPHTPSHSFLFYPRTSHALFPHPWHSTVSVEFVFLHR